MQRADRFISSCVGHPLGHNFQVARATCPVSLSCTKKPTATCRTASPFFFGIAGSRAASPWFRHRRFFFLAKILTASAFRVRRDYDFR